MSHRDLELHIDVGHVVSDDSPRTFFRGVVVMGGGGGWGLLTYTCIRMPGSPYIKNICRTWRGVFCKKKKGFLYKRFGSDI